MTDCRFCGAKVGGELDDTLRKLRSCNNCRIDIQMCGDWTGTGDAILRDLIARYGKQAVADAADRLEAARGKVRP